MNFTEPAIPPLFGLADKEGVRAGLQDKSLTAVGTRFNIRGVRRVQEGVVRFCIVQAVPALYESTVSRSARRSLLGMCDDQGDGVIPAPVSKVHMRPLLGLAVERSDGTMVAVHRAVIMVQGSQKSTLLKLSADKEIYAVTSEKATCVLGGGKESVQR